MKRHMAKTSRIAGKRNFDIGRLKSIDSNLKIVILELKDELTTKQALALYDVCNLITKVATDLAAKYYKGE